ncbi:hypothetical protein [Bacillus paralicheniformis]|uniref:hypothetical protein n=1 Tax=Bacillus TaxID=1386 RepID=UPI000502AF47|nr:hypothetical protein [Bacillus paralicheniformis]KFM90156.1 hypothetical protein DJ88_2083 [Bacillus paralicheniformis]MDR4213260.1 hypothetical protein [Bacillus paralicheniformis]MEC2172899.1 hypothetical protein [Bacillus paralicheniformis]QEO05442.1 hypothetical protein FLQ07_07520 [Bacillus paralicheniformis]TWJ60840.1 hypothetical protein CHCC5022_3826 [Bacillus paralicheniformis]
MQTDKQLFEKTKQMAEAILLSKAENDEELMAYLEKQDLSTLNRLKVYFSGPTLKISHVIKASLASSIFASIVTTVFSGQANFILPDVSKGYFPTMLSILLVISSIWVFGTITKSQRNKDQNFLHFRKKSDHAKIIGMMNVILENKYKDMLTTKK